MNENYSNGLEHIVAQALEELKREQGKDFQLNLAELERRTGVSRAKLRRMKENNFLGVPHARTGSTAQTTVLSGYTDILDRFQDNPIGQWNVTSKRRFYLP